MTRERHPTTRTWTFPERTNTPPSDPNPVDGSGGERDSVIDVLPGGIERVNLKELAARPDRLEHHLVIVARLGVAQLELATASEPLYFAHVNISDEYALPLPTGDPLLDAFPMRTFVADATTGADIGRYNHKCGDLVLHPLGHAHWPGKLRPPYEGMAIPPGMRRCGVSVVYCASVPTPSSAPQLPPPAKPDDVKAYPASVPSTVPTTVEAFAAVPMLGLASTLGSLDRLASLGRSTGLEPQGVAALARPSADAGIVIARIGDTELALVENPTLIGPPQGGWVVVLAIKIASAPNVGAAVATGPTRATDPSGEPDATGASGASGATGASGASGASASSTAGSSNAAVAVSIAVGDLLRVPAGARLDGAGIARCLVLRGSAEPEPVPSTWRELPAIPFPVFEDGARGELPFVHGGLRIEERSPTTVAVFVDDAVAEVPRHWLARMLYRIALHNIRLNYVETYGGLFVDDSSDEVAIGLHIGSRKVAIGVPRVDALGVIERLYRAVAPPDYRERIA